VELYKNCFKAEQCFSQNILEAAVYMIISLSTPAASTLNPRA